VEVEAAYYSAPPGWIGRWIKVQWDGLLVRLLDPKSGQLAARTHTPETWLVSHQRRRPSSAHSPARLTSAVASRAGGLSYRNQGASGMNLIELDRALRQLRLGGMAAVIETRSREMAGKDAAGRVGVLIEILHGRDAHH
jgi:hypothetical protein